MEGIDSDENTATTTIEVIVGQQLFLPITAR
jgi:hypothetical protein